MSTFFLEFLLLAAALCCGQIALANDGFYQGGGSSLRPLENIQMRVIEEKLLIHPMPEPVCYRVRFRGRFADELRSAHDLPPFDDNADEFAEIAGPSSCPPTETPPYQDRLLSLWQAQAEYRVEALADQDGVQMGFPLPIWYTHYPAPDGEWYPILPVPAVANFRVFIDGKLVENPRLVWLEVPNPADSEATRTLGFAWRASFEEGRRYTLRTEYDFGADYATGFDLPEEGLPWFRANAAEQDVTTLRLLYYLSPLRAWGAQPPERISIEIRRPPGVPSAYLVPVTPKPVCVDAYSLRYEYRDAYPDSELAVFMPYHRRFSNDAWGEPATWPKLETPEQWRRWRQTLGEAATIACASMDGVSEPEGVACAEHCPGESIEPSIMLPRFEDFPADAHYTGEVAAPDVKSQPQARRFRTMLRESAAGGVNLAGRYILASWGCGSGCADAAILDAKTGKVYFDPFVSGVSWAGGTGFDYAGGPPEGVNSAFDFRPASRLLFVSGVPAQADWGVMNALSALTWEGNALRLRYTAYGAIPQDDEWYDYNYHYYARLSRAFAIELMLDDATDRDGANAARLAEDLLAWPLYGTTIWPPP